MERKETNIKIYPHNYWCISCASMNGSMVTAEHIVWEEVEQKAIPLCDCCHEVYMQDANFFNIFSVN